MKLPNGHRAYIDSRKLRDYCLNPRSTKGRDKAKVFSLVLGLTQQDDKTLRSAILQAVIAEECQLGEVDRHGQRFSVRFEMRTPRGIGWVQSAWIIRTGEDYPRLTTCFVLKRR